MRIAVDFDDTIVEQDRPYDDTTTPLVFKPGAEAALHSLKRAGHQLLLWSARASAHLRTDPELDVWVRAGVRKLDRARWEKKQPVNEARYQQMLAFVKERLPDVFDAIDDGRGGKPSVDLFIDDRALRLGHGTLGVGWSTIANIFGEPEYAAAEEA